MLAAWEQKVCFFIFAVVRPRLTDAIKAARHSITDVTSRAARVAGDAVTWVGKGWRRAAAGAGSARAAEQVGRTVVVIRARAHADGRHQAGCWTEAFLRLGPGHTRAGELAARERSAGGRCVRSPLGHAAGARRAAERQRTRVVYADRYGMAGLPDAHDLLQHTHLGAGASHGLTARRTGRGRWLYVFTHCHGKAQVLPTFTYELAFLSRGAFLPASRCWF